MGNIIMEAGNVNKRITILILGILITTWSMRCQTVFDKDTTYVFYNPETTPFVERSSKLLKTGGFEIRYYFDMRNLNNLNIMWLIFVHSNLYLDEPADTTLIRPISFLNTISYIRMEDIIHLSNKQLNETFYLYNDKDELKERKIFIIDKNEVTDNIVVLRQFRIGIGGRQ